MRGELSLTCVGLTEWGVRHEQWNRLGRKTCEGAGRRPHAKDGTERKMRSMRASDGEWEAIKKFAKILKENPEKAEEIIGNL